MFALALIAGGAIWDGLPVCWLDSACRKVLEWLRLVEN